MTDKRDDFTMSLCSVKNLIAAIPALIIAGIDIIFAILLLDKGANEAFWDNGIHYVLVFNIIFLVICTFLAFKIEFLYKHQVAAGVLLTAITVVSTFSWMHFGLEICIFPDIDADIREHWYIGAVGAAIFLKVTIVTAHAAYLKWKDKMYWEERPACNPQKVTK